MYFKKLEIVGFKSFMEKTALNFEPGITAVVGPNGCGKSNIFDSIRWVLGEQSAKSLRGTAMEDVIFNGTDTKPALGMAEVSLSFDNSAKFFPVDGDEVTITRRLFRSGESEYLLNRAQVRLKDIQDILLGTGIGAESYSIIAQGKIDLVLSSKPEERRAVFDEASGITKYKAQKREALRRLEETDNNLLRINDIITEVKRSIGYLERQANKARRYQVVFEDLKKKEIQLAVIQKNALVSEKQKFIIGMDNLKSEEEALHRKIQEQESSLNQRNEELRSFEEKLNQVKADIVNLENLIQRNTQHIQFNHERIKELEGSKKYVEGQILQTRERLVQDQEKLSRLQEEQQYIRRNIDEKTVALQQSESELHALVESIRAATESIAHAKKTILDVVTRVAQRKNEFTDLTSKHQVLLSRKKRLELEKAKVFDEKSQFEVNLHQLAADLLQLESEFQQTGQKLSATKEESDRVNKDLAELNAQLSEEERRLMSLQSQKEFLERLRNQYEDITESMNARIHLDKLPSEKITGLVVKINQHPELPADMTGQNVQDFQFLGEAKPIDLSAELVAEKIKKVEEQIAVLKFNKATKEQHLQELSAGISGLTDQLQAQEVALSNKRTVHHTVVEQFNKISEEEQIILLELSEVESELKTQEDNLQMTQRQIADLEQEHRNLETSIHDAQESINANAKVKEQVLVAVAQVKTELDNLNKRMAAEEADIQSLADACRQDEAEIADMEERLKDTSRKQEALATEIADLEARTVGTRQEISEKSAQFDAGQEEYRQLSAALEAVTRAIDEERKTYDTLKDKLYEMQMQEKDLDFKYQSIKQRLMQSYKIDLDSSVPLDVLAPAPVVAASAPAEAAPAQIEPAPVESTPVEPAPTGEVPPAPDILAQTLALDPQMLSDEIQRLREKVSSYGTVNLVAIEEYDELKKRYDFLTQQQNDLLTGKTALTDAIQKINRTTRKMFMETFEKVREEFRNYFRLLFNGGDAQVYLIDENDPLETGIEIICRPPGKKLQNVLLLSGGEKSMSAIALIFAIFKVKPAPFCILDEIDAALDEANVDRFGRMLQDFSQTSQFIVITHNKRTISNADVMYGITMQESGVSKIVSVKFSDRKQQEPQQQAEAAVAA
ncbi:MAG TPA: AAA family ATPase [Candidatus Omnitrophota bacterium]|nr:AAA family ATPase [Candidatus Omnitrophota bacterium]HRZ15626.1 AAA family ATPase [Candidatus Omnitrophota bacterium]